MAGGADTAGLVSAVSSAGGLGFVGAAYLTAEQIIERGQEIRRRTSSPFGINLFAPLPPVEAKTAELERAIERVRPYFEELGIDPPQAPKSAPSQFDEQLAACLEAGAAAFSFAFGHLPAAAVVEIKQRGVYLIGTATTVAEARALVDSGVDAVVAQGSEAGGHRSTFLGDFGAGMVGTTALVPQVADAVPVPVIASGGIMDGRGVVAAIALGASAAQMGTAFLTCDEAGVAQAYKETILSAAEDDTRITRAFSGRPARGIANRLLRDLEGDPDAILPFPLQNALTRPLRNEATKRNKAEYLSLWAGQGVRLARRTTAAELIHRLQIEIDAAADSLDMRRR
jgi:nitronate monooxygenase